MYTIGLCVDEAYLLPGLVTLMSTADALSHRDRQDVAIRILTPDLTRSHVEIMAEYCRKLGFKSFDLDWHQPPSNCIIVEGNYISTTTYLRFQFTPSFVGHPYLIYLDSDVLVLDDISEPLGVLEKRQVGAARDEFNHTVGKCPALPGLVEQWPKLYGRLYYNAGALWLYSNLMPTVKAGVWQALRDQSRFVHHNDQDALNLWLLAEQNTISLPAKFNRFETDRFLEKGDWVTRVVKRSLRSADTAMLHFVGPMKPWLNSCPTTHGVRLYRSYMRSARMLLCKLGDRTVNVSMDG